MAVEDDRVVEKLEIWKKRVFIVFLLIASIFGATALLLLELGVVEKAWKLEWAGPVASFARASSPLPPPSGPPIPVLVIRLASRCDGDARSGGETMMDVPSEVRFDAAMHELYDRIGRETGYTPTMFLRMIERYGGVETAHRLLKPGTDFFSYGFEHLCRIERDDLTMESLILSLDYRNRIFSDRELATAAKRLTAARLLCFATE